MIAALRALLKWTLICVMALVGQFLRVNATPEWQHVGGILAACALLWATVSLVMMVRRSNGY